MAPAAGSPGRLQKHAKALIFIGFFGVPAIAKMAFSEYNISYFKPRAKGAPVKYRKPLKVLDKICAATSVDGVADEPHACTKAARLSKEQRERGLYRKGLLNGNHYREKLH
jgi:hypothetical protein